MKYLCSGAIFSDVMTEEHQKLLYFSLVLDMVKRRDFKANRMLFRLTVYHTC